MEIRRAYAKQVRDHLGFFPVWPPGDVVAPGDIGRLEDGIFHREGAITEVIPGVQVQVAERGGQANRFRSSDCVAGSVTAKGGGSVQPGLTAQAEMTLTFGAEGGVAFDFADGTERGLTNLLAIRSMVEAARDLWNAEYVLVSRVTEAANFLVIVAGASGASVAVAGDADALGQWNLAHAALAFSGGNQGGFQATGSGPLLLGLYGFDWWSRVTGTGSLKPLSMAVPETHAFREVPARDAAFD